MDRVKYSFIPKKDIQRTNKLSLSNSKAPSKGKCYLLMSYNVNDVTGGAPRDDIGNVILMAQGAKQDFILHFATKLMLQSCFLVNNKVQTKLTPILVPDKNTHELGNNVNPTSKSKNFHGLEKWEKNHPS